MKSEKKNLLKYYRDMLAHSIRMLFSNKTRIRLTVIGVTITVALLSFASLFMYDNYLSIQNEYAMWPKNVFCVKSNCMTDSQLTAVINEQPDLFVNAFYEKDDCLYKDNINIRVIGVRNADMKTGYLPDMGSGVFIPQLLLGRVFTEAEICGHESAVIITESTALLLFGKINSIGQVVKLTHNNDVKSYQIVGIIKDSVQSATYYNEFIQKHSVDTTVNITFYTPLANAVDNDVYSINFAVFYTLPEYSIRQLAYSNRIECIFTNQNTGSYLSIMPSETFDIQYTESIENFTNGYFSLFRSLVICETVIMLLFILFSMKERVREIGIRKAVGASDSDIITQFILENLIFSLNVSAFGCFLGLITYLIIQYQGHLGDVFLICTVSWQTLFLTFMFSFSLIILTSILPGLISKRIRIVDALRFE